MRTVTRRRLAAAVLAVALAACPTACSGDSSDSSSQRPADEPAGSQATEEPAPLETTATLGKVTGKLSKDKRSRVRQQVGQAVDAWFEAAYVGGEYPRSDFSDSWPAFTKGALARARSAKALMSNQDIGSGITGVEATARKVTVDVLAVKGHAVGATARVVLRFSTEGEIARDVQVRGRLFLTRSAGGWDIFGFDVTKGSPA